MAKKKDFRYIYGPIYSWRLGVSLGVDLLPTNSKTCTFDCIYCQLGGISKYTKTAKIYVKVPEVIAELKALPAVKVDYITFSGSGEPSLAKNLGEAIKAVKKLNIAPVAVLTNASLMRNPEIRKNLNYADFVVAKLDACSQESLERINKPMRSIKFQSIVAGIKQFKKKFKGKFALQMMLTEENKREVEKLVDLARDINPDEVQINTPLRPCKVMPLSSTEIARIKECFSGLNVICVYDVIPKRVIPLSQAQTLQRRGKIT